ncbi:class II fructose-bisphosphate aldolase [Mycolicibacterium smegmatis]|uniref:Tagatose-1,6-bisphosphate aldolase GatY n=1 Tax=Mycolicibacterium smegmatis (strain MKD8) TaxID=1214915 RepID=A0A2U9PJP7_MYCSE|nr:class II fructose-bisphosphate aldolase [Mycolicibacterium smegmatis]AWT51951.1 tagatose-1,6-bisphosphate aldolase GatY [Mycolicibacterium smegmatis MKD8]MDF1898852.1 class II fructose-bisphosphate aldolase [Mycolicibacterium smegmatis]MDF1904676.1 class II fructose-bisphosphate aldolase [Mycolicibacterium smegmatis]MDF1918545.1 class II fructose-bisphosphate aldolase [Mycolicibacterium smegmatis]MDF1923840.1 class II fructose-bisphosphate aldolase [Mycolicibacterium smegmatis]
MKAALTAARATRNPLPAFTCYTLETAVGVLEAAETVSRPVILLVSDAAMRDAAGARLVTALVAVAQQARVPAWVQLDHCADLERIRHALDLGAGAVMADGSHLDDAANARFVERAVALAEPFDAAVEAELGRVEGDEDIDLAVEAGALTDPDAARRFVASTGVDCLAVAVGNVHGSYRQRPRLDWPRLARIVEELPVAVSLHGTSGLPAEDRRRAQQLGVVKFNVNTELRRGHMAVLRDRIAHDPASTDVLALTAALRRRAAEVAEELIT